LEADIPALHRPFLCGEDERNVIALSRHRRFEMIQVMAALHHVSTSLQRIIFSKKSALFMAPEEVFNAFEASPD
jgi:hypothetical protein